MKDSALVYIVGVTELLKSTQILVTRLRNRCFLLLICGAFYFAHQLPHRPAGRLPGKTVVQ